MNPIFTGCDIFYQTEHFTSSQFPGLLPAFFRGRKASLVIVASTLKYFNLCEKSSRDSALGFNSNAFLETMRHGVRDYGGL